MKRTITWAVPAALVFIVLLVLPAAGRYAYFYSSAQMRPEVERPVFGAIQVPTPSSRPFADEVAQPGDGIVVVDLAHDNQLDLQELSVLGSRLAARGFRLETWTGGGLADVLVGESGLIVAVPLEPYDEDEVEAVEDFVSSGGRLLMIGDPTRFGTRSDAWGLVEAIEPDVAGLNSVAAAFGITFVDDYLYNVTTNEGSFRDIRLRDWGPLGERDALTEGLETVVFYAAHSLAVPDGAALLRADADTWSSATDRAGGLVVAALAASGNVLALGDLTFLTEPYHTVQDNGHFVARIADFLAGARRSYGLADFPLLFGRKTAFVFPGDPDLGPGQVEMVDDLQEAFAAFGKTFSLAAAPDPRQDLIYAGLYSQADSLAADLGNMGITLVFSETADQRGDDELGGRTGEEPSTGQGEVAIDGMGSFQMPGLGLIVVDGSNGRQVVTVLAASHSGLARLLRRLPDRDLVDCFQADRLFLCPTGIPDEEVAPAWEPMVLSADEEPGEEVPAERPVQGRLQYGDQVSGTLGEDEEHDWQFDGAAGDLVTVRTETESPEFDLVLSLVDPAGEVLVTADDTTAGAEEIRAEELPVTGEYRVRVREYWGASGSYTLTVDLAGEGIGEAAEVMAGSIDFGDTVEGELARSQTAVWTFYGEADQAITIVLGPDTDSDLVLELFADDGRPLASMDEGLTGEEERIEGRLPATGTFRIAVREFWGLTATFSLSLEAGGVGDTLGARSPQPAGAVSS